MIQGIDNRTRSERWLKVKETTSPGGGRERIAVVYQQLAVRIPWL
jgi:hypothetical protein